MKNYDKYVCKSIDDKKEVKSRILEDLKQHNHIILYGNNDYYNYCYMVSLMRKVSPKKLKYVRRIEVEYNSNIYSFNLTDLFVEVDFDLLGVNEYHVFMELYSALRESYLQNNIYIFCVNFYKVRKELHNSLYTILNSDSRIRYIFLTSQIEFMNTSILSQCRLYKNVFNTLLDDDPCFQSHVSYKSFHDGHIEKLIQIITKKHNISTKELRNIIYEILIYNFDVYKYLNDLIESLITLDYICEDNLVGVFKNFTHIIEKYNNNYRSIFHLEYFIIYLMNLNE